MRAPSIVERKLGRERAVGLAYRSARRIVVDPRRGQRARLDTLMHEALHIAAPEWSEDRVSEVAGMLCKVAWKDRYRRVEK